MNWFLARSRVMMLAGSFQPLGRGPFRLQPWRTGEEGWVGGRAAARALHDRARPS